jgi:hypothetical protein
MGLFEKDLCEELAPKYIDCKTGVGWEFIKTNQTIEKMYRVGDFPYRPDDLYELYIKRFLNRGLPC